ncbi:type II toxin-antitoxin system RelE/ParE family toxin [Desulfobacterales bacterium HSG17]|nr:type II toxin-antitoxin system RelE/ParE family toxin [Desulfobacterales bacterium HSG17]
MNKRTQIIQSNLFAKQKKKLHKQQIKDLDNAVRTVVDNPEIGNMKTGDLSGVRVYKFRSMKSLILMAYELVDYDTLCLYAVGSHENFYQKLKILR